MGLPPRQPARLDLFRCPHPVLADHCRFGQESERHIALDLTAADPYLPGKLRNGYETVGRRKTSPAGGGPVSATELHATRHTPFAPGCDSLGVMDTAMLGV